MLNDHSLQCYHFDRPPLITLAPELELPQGPVACGEVWIKYPTVNNPIPLHFADSFKAIVEFRLIMNDIANTAFSVGAEQPMLLSKAMEFRGRLQQWYERLPSCLNAVNLIVPAHFHIQYVCSSKWL
jgi:hypothetical protein